MRLRSRRGLTAAVTLPVLAATTFALAGAPAAQASAHRAARGEARPRAGHAVARPALIPTPYQDSFYTQPNPMPDVPPGTVLNSRQVTVTALGIPANVTAWQVLYASTGQDGQPVADVATILIPDRGAATSPRPLLAYQVAEDADTQLCAPSYQMRLGIETEEPLIAAALEQGWVVVVSDYEGLNSIYTGGLQEGHGVLDAIRAAESFGPAGLSGASTPVGLWGYSGGALASAWASELEPSYAPELDIKGIAEGGVPADIGHIAQRINGGPFSGLYFAAAFGLARAFPQLIDLNTLLNPAGQVAKNIITNECVAEYVPQFALQHIQMYTNGFIDPLTLPGVQQAIALDNLGQRTPAGPLFVYQAVNDEIIPLADVQALTDGYCREGVAVDFVKDEIGDHVSLAVSGAGAALNYLIDRFAGNPAPSTCSTGGVTVASDLIQPANNLVTSLTAAAGLTGFF